MQAEQSPWTGVEPLTSDDPSSVGGLRLLGRLGEGGMGAVYLGLSDSGQRVAVKVVRRDMAADPGFRARFDTEVANARRVASFCTARVLDHGESDGVPYLVTEYIAGPSLADHIEAEGALGGGSLRGLAVGVATALAAIHAVRLVHRDLKPRNVMLAEDGPRVIDFGIARALDADDHHTRTGGFVGSPGWCAPEQVFDGRVSPAVDVFAWGTLVAYAATGRHPYGVGNLPTLAARAQQAQFDLSGVPPELLPHVQAALHPDPSARPTSYDLLQRLVGTDNPQAAASTVINREWSPALQPATRPAPPRRRTWLITLIAAATTALVVAGVTAGALALASDSHGKKGSAHSPGAAPKPASKPAGKAEFVRIARPCDLVSPALRDQITPQALVEPRSNSNPQDLATDGAQTGCTLTSEKYDSEDPSTVGDKQLILSIKLRRTGPGRDGTTEAARDTAAYKADLLRKAGTNAGGMRFDDVRVLPGLGDEAFVSGAHGTTDGKGDDQRFRTASAAAFVRTGNAEIKAIYAFSYPLSNKPSAGYDLVAREQISRQRAAQALRDVLANLQGCADCKG
ncbi:serine/threonine-protein kinase [Actinomadura rupiterrae]|uniref:serine/threonine-protein kinase n=1 Tax=Actinomadura rupiterrae TaxID=559627 RepID=UPI0026462BE2|nr:serine/threonine protein kinase [Actinomadura rupiterrae]MCP2337011.1 serine/threonine protein kinase [Actinomadura rupiterrae]